MTDIEVIYNDGLFGFVDPLELDRLIKSGEIVKFLRGDSWVYPGVDQTRRAVGLPVSDEKRAANLGF